MLIVQFAWNVKAYFLGKIRNIFQNVVCWIFFTHMPYLYVLKNLDLLLHVIIVWVIENGSSPCIDYIFQIVLDPIMIHKGGKKRFYWETFFCTHILTHTVQFRIVAHRILNFFFFFQFIWCHSNWSRQHSKIFLSFFWKNKTWQFIPVNCKA